MFLDATDVDRFWSNVDTKGENDCWEWTRSCNNQGYGYFGLNKKVVKAHRVAFTVTYGQILEFFEGLPAYICHKSDNPKCCNPRHLFLENSKINQRDSIFKGRKPQANLVEFQVREIRQDLKKGVLTHKEIGGRYGVSRTVVTRINTGECWSHVTV